MTDEAAARRHAHAAAARAGVDVREIDGADVAAAQQVIAEAWGPGQAPANLLQALAHAGNVVLAAFRDGRPIGVAFGFLGWTGGLHLHSHMTAVTTACRSHGVGYALKAAQRAICLERGIGEVRWTYDPLIARNAYFNLVKLGAEVRDFRPDFYGAMSDTVNAGDHSDRFEVSWLLSSDRAVAALEHGVRPRFEGGEPVAVPADFAALRQSDPDAASAVRLASRERFAALFAAGLRPEWGDGGYVFVPAASPVTTETDVSRGGVAGA